MGRGRQSAGVHKETPVAVDDYDLFGRRQAYAQTYWRCHAHAPEHIKIGLPVPHMKELLRRKSEVAHNGLAFEIRPDAAQYLKARQCRFQSSLSGMGILTGHRGRIAAG